MLARRYSFCASAFLIAMFATRIALAQLPAELAPVIQNPETVIVNSSTQVLNEVMATSATSIPLSLLRDAQGIAIVPSMVKGGFVIGVRHGRGVLTTRTETGAWTAPTFITITGGSIGWQAGLQSTDLILVFRTRKSIQGIMNGKFTIGADASASAGPVGRNASASTDARLQAEILSYSRSRGLFAGVSLDGSVIQIDQAATSQFYWNGGAPPPNETEQVLPPSAGRLLEAIARYTAPNAAELMAASNPGTSGQLAPPAASQELTDNLLNSSRALFKLVDPSWQTFLALPAAIYGTNDPAAPSLETALARYQKIANDPQYKALNSRAEFQETFALLQSYARLHPSTGRLSLPPPPTSR